jgi:hypothetical protein
MRNCGPLGQQLLRPKHGGSWLVWASTLRCRIGLHRSSQGAGVCVSPWLGGLGTLPPFLPIPDYQNPFLSYFSKAR